MILLLIILITKEDRNCLCLKPQKSKYYLSFSQNLIGSFVKKTKKESHNLSIVVLSLQRLVVKQCSKYHLYVVKITLIREFVNKLILQKSLPGFLKQDNQTYWNIRTLS